MATQATVEQLFRHEIILRAISQVGGPGRAFTQFYGLGAGTVSQRSATARFALDIFNDSRLLANARAPEAGPGTIARKPSGTFNGTLLRLHEKMPITDNQIANYRPVGAPVGTLDRGGVQWVNRQTRYMMQRFGNAREFVISRMFRGAVGIKASGDDMIICEGGGGDWDINFQVPSGNKTTVGGIFPSDSWDTASTDIASQFLALDALSERISGYRPAIAWLNSNGYSRLLNNTKLASQHGTARRVFDLQTMRELATIPDGSRSSGFLVKFDVIPQITFIVYDGALSPDRAVDSTDAADNALFIPDGKMIVTPAPGGDWIDMVSGGEYVRENKADNNPTFHWGFYNWVEPTTQPSGRELIAVDWFMPYFPVPTAVFYVDIYTP